MTNIPHINYAQKEFAVAEANSALMRAGSSHVLGLQPDSTIIAVSCDEVARQLSEGTVEVQRELHRTDMLLQLDEPTLPDKPKR